MPWSSRSMVIVLIAVFQWWNMAYSLVMSVIMTNDSPETAN